MGAGPTEIGEGAGWAAADGFIAKAIGWALRDLARLEPTAVSRFLDEHPTANPVVVREARRRAPRRLGSRP